MYCCVILTYDWRLDPDKAKYSIRVPEAFNRFHNLLKKASSLPGIVFTDYATDVYSSVLNNLNNNVSYREQLYASEIKTTVGDRLTNILRSKTMFAIQIVR
ncbi:hypothetical protein TNCV_1767511 [Trichonephila clavipes]|nr:hypothetical protein TNCV_1767511 [Trichonephila clavipes]